MTEFERVLMEARQALATERKEAPENAETIARLEAAVREMSLIAKHMHPSARQNWLLEKLGVLFYHHGYYLSYAAGWNKGTESYVFKAYVRRLGEAQLELEAETSETELEAVVQVSRHVIGNDGKPLLDTVLSILENPDSFMTPKDLEQLLNAKNKGEA